MNKKNKLNLVNLLIVGMLILGNLIPGMAVFAETVLEEVNPTIEQTISTEEESIPSKESTNVVPPETEDDVTEIIPPAQPELNQAESKQPDEIIQPEIIEEKEATLNDKKSEVEEKQKKEVAKKKLTIIGTSDVHGNMWDYSYEDNKDTTFGFARISSIVKKARADNPNTIVVDSGDTIQGTILTDDVFNVDPELKDMTHPLIAAMNYIGYDTMSLGNHEFNFGIDLIKKIDADAQFPLLSANTYYKGTDTHLVKPYEILEVDGVKVGVLGLTIPHVPLWDGEKVASLEFTDLNKEARKQVNIMKGLPEAERPDIIVGAIHAGLENSDPGAAAINVIKEVPEIDAFVLGHDHREFAEKIEKKPVGAVQDTGTGAVKIDLELEQDPETEKWSVASSEVGIEHSKNYPSDEGLRQTTEAHHEIAKNYISGVIGHASADFLPPQEVPGIPEAQLRPTALISLINNVQRDLVGTDLSLSALFKEDSDLKAGEITYGTLFDIYKYPNTLVSTTITGANLKEYLESQADYYLQTKDGDVTIGFNEKMRIYIYDMLGGGTYKINISKPVGERIEDLKVNGQLVTDSQEFTIAMNNYRYSQLLAKRLVGDVIEDTDPYSLRSGIADYIRKKGTINPADELEESFEIIGTDFDQELRDYVIAEIHAGNITVPRSADGRTPNVKALNVYELAAEGKIPVEMLNGKGFTIMHTNDMHGRLEFDEGGKSLGMAKLKTFKDSKAPTLLVDAGDAMQGLPISNYSKGMDMVKAMNAVGYDAMTLGNHEFDFGLETALAYKDKLNFDLVSANVYQDGKLVFDPYVIKEKQAGEEKLKFALIGLTTPETAVKTHPNNVKGVEFKKPAPVAIDVVKEIGDKADVFVFMTHLGVDETTVEDERSTYLAQELAKNFPDKKIFIIDGHSHSEFKEGRQEGHILMGQTGNHLNNVGLISADYAKEKPKLKAALHPFAELKDLAPDPVVEQIVTDARTNYDKEMSGVVLKNNPVKFNGVRDHVRSRETNLGNIIGDALYDYGQTGFNNQTDFAVVNGGGIRANLELGAVTKGDIVGVMPFGNTIAQIQISGSQIYDLFEFSLRSPHATDEAGNVLLDENGLPKLGSNGGFLQVSESVRVTYDSNKTGAAEGIAGERVSLVELRDAKTGKFVPVDKKKADYYVATNDFLAAGGDGFSMLGGPREEGSSLDTVFLEFLEKQTNETLVKYEKELSMDRIISKLSETNENDFSFSIMHTNDMHGRMLNDEAKTIGLAKLKTFRDEKQPTLMIDAGDALQGLAISNVSKGMKMAEVMSKLPYDAVGVGNHEFDFGYDQAMTYKDVLPIISANVTKAGQNSFEANRIVEKEGKRFALIGLSTPETAFKTHPDNVKGVTFAEPIEVARAQLKQLKNDADVFVFVTHLGVDKTTPALWRSDTLAETLSKEYPDQKIIIIDGHSHTTMPTGQEFGNVLLAQTGEHLNNVGMIEISYKDDKPTFKAELIPASDFTNIVENPEIKEIVAKAKEEFDKEMGEVVIPNNPVFFEGDGAFGRTRETNLGNIIGDALYNYGQTGFSQPSDFAVINGGGIRTSIKTGPVTKGDILAVLPFGNTIAQIDVTGKQIYEMFEHSLRAQAQKAEDETILLDDKGLPLLGRNGGFLQVSDSINIIYDSNLTGALPEKNVVGERVLRVQLRDRVSGEFKDVDLAKTYRVATNDFLAAGGDGYTMLGGAHEAGPSMDTVFTEFLQGLATQAGGKVVPFTKGKYALADYENKFPYSRIIPMTQADFDELIGGQSGLDGKLVAALETEIAESEKLKEKDHTKESWKAFAIALKDAKDVLEVAKGQMKTRAVVTNEEVKSATAALKSARGKLKLAGETPKPDPVKELTEKLAAEIAKVEKLVKADYTKASWDNLQTALAEAKALIAKGEKDEKVLETALNNLKAAQVKLVKVSTKGNGNKDLPKAGSEDLIAWIPGATLILFAYAGYLRKRENVL